MTDIFDIGNANQVAILMQEWLKPIPDADSPVYPPTYAPPKSDKDGKSDYCIDTTRNGNVCLLDSVGSQANRLEPLFMNKKYRSLIPQIVITLPSSDPQIPGKKINICEVGHRIADAFVRNTDQYLDIIKPALNDLVSERRDALKLAKLAPTSLVFGMWDSRGTNAKIPRIIASTIRAYDVERLTTSAQYTPAANYKDAGVFTSDTEQDKLSSWGFSFNPATGLPGGVLVHGSIRRDLVINLAALRKITTIDLTTEKKMQKYLLGLALVVATAPTDPYLREGCLMVRDSEKPQTCIMVDAEGTKTSLDINHDKILEETKQLADEFGVGDSVNLTFSLKMAKDEVKTAKKTK